MSDNEPINKKLYYSMGDVAKMFDVNHSLIRYWEKEFTMLKPSKNKKGERIFTAKDIETLKIIYTLVKERGYTLNGAKEMLKAERIDETRKKMEIIDSLEKVKGFLIELKSQM